MDDQQKQSYLERYKRAKEQGEPFFPNAIFKDAVISLLVLAVILGLIVGFGVPLEARADPADTSYTPRPEWYFLFLFQLLKYFPGQLEVIGVFVIPTIFLLILFGLPFIDRSSKRHPLDRPWVTGSTTLVMAAVVFLTIQSVLEAPPPSEEDQGDPVAKLYTDNCAGCHGSMVQVASSTSNLHEIIAQGSHSVGMPAWSGDLSSDEIDALVGFISSPSGSSLFNQQCGQCHQAADLVAGDPIQLKQALETGPAFPPHADVGIGDWQTAMTAAERSDLLNFLVAPDGQRLYVINCAPCHGSAVSFSGEESELRAIIEEGGLHLNMPAWRGRLPQEQVEALAAYVVAPLDHPETESLFRQSCSTCHGALVPRAETVEQAEQIILTGGPHETMPVWGQALTEEQLDALTSYTLATARGTPLELGRSLFGQYCASCHGEFGEGGLNPTRAGDVIAPISSAEYLRTRDNFTLTSVVSQGQPNFGMSPFAASNGGPLDDEQISAIVEYIRSWEANPPVELPPEVETEALALEGADIFTDLCAQCHGGQGQGLIGPDLTDPAFLAGNSDDELYQTINEGHPATAMIGWGEVLTADQIDQLVRFIRSLATETSTPADGGEVSFQNDVLPIFERDCAACHGTFGGWDASSYQSVMSSGDNAPVVVPGDPAASLLAQKLEGTQEIGGVMPPSGPLPQEEIDVVLDWIAAGAADN